MVGRAASTGEPSIVVVPAAASQEWPRLTAEAATVITRERVQRALADRIQRRDAVIATRVADLELELDDLVAELEHATARLVEAEEDHAALLRWADWCEAQPAEAADGIGAVVDATRNVEQRSAEAREASRALDDVLEQQATAEAALEEARMEVQAHSAPGLAESDVRQELERAERSLSSATTDEEAADARRRIEVLHRTLTVRAEPRNRDEPHHETVAALAQQVEALEARLSEAVAAARSRADAALRALAQAEQVLERLHQRERARHRRLRDAVAELPAELRPRQQENLLDHAEAIADGLRTHAESLLPGLDETAAAVDQLTARREELHRELETVRAGTGRFEDDDVVGVLRELLDGAAPPVVLDDPLSADEWPAVLADLAAHPPEGRVVVLTGDSVVLDWAIDLPPSVGGVVLAPLPSLRHGADRTDGAEDASDAEAAGLLQFAAEPADAQDATEPDEPVISLDRLRAFAFRTNSESRRSDEP